MLRTNVQKHVPCVLCAFLFLDEKLKETSKAKGGNEKERATSDLLFNDLLISASALVSSQCFRPIIITS